jgi:hypothetical protein
MNDITFAMDPTQHHTGYPLPHVVAAQQGYGVLQQYGAPLYRLTPQVSRTVTRGPYFHFLYFYLSCVLLQSVM